MSPAFGKLAGTYAMEMMKGSLDPLVGSSCHTFAVHKCFDGYIFVAQFSKLFIFLI